MAPKGWEEEQEAEGEAAEAPRPKLPLGKLVATTLTALSLTGGAALLGMMITGGKEEQERAFANGQYARVLLKNGAVEGNLTPKEALEPKEKKPEKKKEKEENAVQPQPEAPVAAKATETSPAPASTPEATADTPPASTPAEGAVSQPGGEVLAQQEAAAEAASLSPTPEPEIVRLSPRKVEVPLNDTMNPDLYEDVKDVGKLPAISKEGVEPWQYYSKPDHNNRALPAVGVMITGLGLDPAVTEQALATPEYVSLSFSPYAADLPKQMARARSFGHEVWLDLPMEPEDFPASDPGPLGLLQDLPKEELFTRLHRVLAAAPLYVGLVATPGEHFSTSPSMKYVAEELGSRGLLLLLRSRDADTGKAADHALSIARTLDELPDGNGPMPEQLLTELEAVAKDDGGAIGVIGASPRVFELVTGWSASLNEKGMVLTPVSALTSRKK